MKEIRTDLYTQKEYSKKVGLTPARINQMVKNGELKVLVIKGAKLIKD